MELDVAMTVVEQRKLWVRAGGQCSLCKTYLLEGALTYAEVPVGEGAHIVGQKNTPGSPRGLDGLPAADRDAAENVMLACANCHNEIDKALVAELMTVQELRRRKKSHEDQIRHLTNLTSDRRSAVLRVVGNVRGAAMELSKETAAEAVVRSSERFPFFLPSYDQQGIEIDLRDIDGERHGSAEYYASAKRRITERVREQVHSGLRNGDIKHLSVFAIARLPLLVFLGWALEDGIAADIYQRHRSTDAWLWPTEGTPRSFALTASGSRDDGGPVADAILITNLSGATSPGELPPPLAGAPVFTLQVVGEGGFEDVINTPATLAAFEATVRRFFSELEVTHKDLRRVHVLGALPVSAAVTLGRCLKARDLRPAVVLYDRTAGGYHSVMEF